MNIGSVTSAMMQKMADLGVTSVQIKCDDAIGYLAVYRYKKKMSSFWTYLSIFKFSFMKLYLLFVLYTDPVKKKVNGIQRWELMNSWTNSLIERECTVKRSSSYFVYKVQLDIQ